MSVHDDSLELDGTAYTKVSAIQKLLFLLPHNVKKRRSEPSAFVQIPEGIRYPMFKAGTSKNKRWHMYRA